MQKLFQYFSLQLARIPPTAYFGDFHEGVQQLSSCLFFRVNLKKSSPKLQESIRELNQNQSYGKQCPIQLLQQIHRGIDMDTLRILFLKTNQSLELPFVETQENQSDFEALLKQFSSQYNLNLLSPNKEDCLSVFLGKFDKNLQCEAQNQNVFISCHIVLLLQPQNQTSRFRDSVRTEWVQVQDLLNYDNLRTQVFSSSEAIQQRLKGASYVTQAAKRKAQRVEFSVLKIGESKLGGIFLDLWLYACQIMIKGTGSNQVRRALSEYVKRAQRFDIKFGFFRPLGFFMRRATKRGHELKIKKNSYYEYEFSASEKSRRNKKTHAQRNVLLGTSVGVGLCLLVLFSYKKWKID